MVSSRARPAVRGEADSQAGPEREGAGRGRELEGSSAGANGRWLEAMKHGRSDQQRTSRAIHLTNKVPTFGVVANGGNGAKCGHVAQLPAPTRIPFIIKT